MEGSVKKKANPAWFPVIVQEKGIRVEFNTRMTSFDRQQNAQGKVRTFFQHGFS